MVSLRQMVSLRRVARSAAFYPVTQVYLAAVLILVGIVGGWLRLDIGLLLLTAVSGLVLLASTRGDVGKIHTLVNSQHDALVEQVRDMGDRMGAMGDRIEELLDAMHEAGVKAPHDRQGVDRDRQER